MKTPILSRIFPITILLTLGMAWAVASWRRWLVALAVALVFVWFLYLRQKHRLESTIDEIDRMTGKEFERFLARLFKKSGYRTTHVGAGGRDFGADLIVEKNKIRIAVQAKNYDRARVGNDAVQQVVAGASFYDCEAALVVTNSMFTKAAKEQAAGSNLPVTLWDRHVLKKALQKKSYTNALRRRQRAPRQASVQADENATNSPFP